MLRRVTLALCLVALVSSGAVFAATTSRLTGEVFDNDGTAMPGVTIQISSDKLIGGPQIAIADGEGRFTFNLLPVGIYTVEASLAGFKPSSGEVQVTLARTAEILFHMVPEQFGGEIEVSAQVPVVDTAQVNTSVTFDHDYLQKAAVGSANRGYLSMIGQAAGVAGTGNASVFGGSSGDNSYLIDGLNTTDPVTGTFGTNFNFDAIQEMNFQTGGFEAEFGQATGGIVNLVTKSGGNEFSGSLDIRYRIAPIEQAMSLWSSFTATHTAYSHHVWQWLDIQAGIPSIVKETTEEFVPQMVNLELIEAVNFKKGCYPGQEIVARMHYLGKAKRRMFKLFSKDTNPPIPGTDLFLHGGDGQSAGKIVLAEPAQKDGIDMLAVIRLSHQNSDQLRLGSEDGPTVEFTKQPYALDAE